MEALIEGARPAMFIPALPTLWPSMLTRARDAAGFYPFAADNVRYFYFARNAVWTAAKVLGLDRGEVLVPAYHHGVEVEALLDAGAQVRFFRVGPRWEVDLDDLERKIGPRTRALYLIHYAGFPGPVAEIKALAERHGLPLIEDCALSLLSSEGDRPLGSTGDLAVFCLYKTLPVPNGGALVVNGPRGYCLPRLPPPPLASTLSHLASSLLQNVELRAGAFGRGLRRVIRALGRRTVRTAGIERVATGTQHFERAHVDLGMSSLTERIALSQDLRRIVEIRRRNYFFLMGRLRELAAPLHSQLPAGVCPLFYPLVVQDKPGVLERLRAAGIEAIDFWRHSHPACEPNEFPEVAQLRRQVVEIPCHQDLDPDTMARVASAVREALAGTRRERTSAGSAGP